MLNNAHNDNMPLGLIVYVLLGIPMAWLHMRQHKMTESFHRVPHGAPQNLIVFTLAVMWPLLLLPLATAHFRKKREAEASRAPSIAADEDRPAPRE
jgi:hypothetical protein